MTGFGKICQLVIAAHKDNYLENVANGIASYVHYNSKHNITITRRPKAAGLQFSTQLPIGNSK